MIKKMTYESLVRIAGWTLFFLLILSAILPQTGVRLRYEKEILAQGIYPIMADPADPRWARPDIIPKSERKTDIIWIAGSSVLIPPDRFAEEGEQTIYDHLPARVKDVLKQEYNIETRTRMSMLLARRALDTYTMTLDAISRQPDFMVVILNPFWDLNEQSVFFKRELFNPGISLWAKRGDWRLVALARPAHMLWALAGSHIPVLRDGYDRMLAFEEMVEKHKLVPDLNLKPKKTKLFADLKYDQPLTFWIVQRFLDGNTQEIESHPGKFDAKMWQLLNLISMRLDREKGWADHYTNKTLQTISESGIPSLVYLAPLSERVSAQPEAYDKYAQVVQRINEMKKTYEHNNLKIITTLPREVEFSMSHVDFLHMDEPGKLSDFLAGEIAAMIESRP